MNGGTVSDSEGQGISVDYGSDGTINNVEIFNNAIGISVSTSHASVGGGNNIHHNRQFGVIASAGAVLGLNGSTIEHNGETGVSVQRRSTLIVLEPQTDASGNYGVDLWCGDKESSVDLGTNFIGSVDQACTGFDE